MSGYYDIATKLYNSLNEDALVNQVTKGDLSDVLNNKQNMFPLCHIMVNNASLSQQVINFNISILCMDIVDFSKDETVSLYVGNNNEDDVMNTTLMILNRVYESLYRGDLAINFDMLSDATCEPFFDKFTESVAGWTMTFDISAENTMQLC
jgi:hypothetical protein